MSLKIRRKIDIKELKLIFLKFATCLVIILIFWGLFGFCRVCGELFDNSVRDGDLVLYSRSGQSCFSDEDLVVINGKVARIIAIAGQLIEYRNGRVYIDGSEGDFESNNEEKVFRVPEGFYLIALTNRDKIEMVAGGTIEGKVFSILRIRNI